MDSTQIEAAPKVEGTGKLSSFGEFFSNFFSLTKKHFKPLLFFVLPSLVGVAIVNLVAQANLPHIVRIIGSIVVGLPLFLFSVATSLGGFKYLKDLEETGVASKKEAYLTGLKNIVFYIFYNFFVMAVLFVAIIPFALVVIFVSSVSLTLQIILTVLAVSILLLGVWTAIRFAFSPLFLVTESISFFSALAKSALVTKGVVGKVLLRAIAYGVLVFAIYIPLTVLKIVELLPVYKTYGFSKMFQIFKSGTLDQFVDNGLLFFITLIIIGLLCQSIVNIMSFGFGYQMLKDLKNRVGEITEETLQKNRKRIKISFWLALIVAVLGFFAASWGVIFFSLKSSGGLNQFTTNLNNPQVYTDTENGFQVTLPASWEYVTSKNQGEPVFSALNPVEARENISAGIPPSGMAVRVEDVPGGATAKMLVEQILNGYKVPYTDANIKIDKDVNGNEYALYEGLEENIHTSIKIYVRGGKAYIVSMVYTAGKIQSMFEAGYVAESFTLTTVAK